MTYKISEKIELNKIKSKEEYKIKYAISENNINKYYALIVNNQDKNPILYDINNDYYINKYDWHVNGGGYANNKIVGYMHSLISHYNKIKDYDNENLSVDHINRIKFDNRVKNLRMATQGQQNSNRDTRSDKKPPCEELIALGINELPKYVRWDNTEKKFIIEKHPQLVKEVTQEIRKKPIMSGTKSSKLTIIQKYQDIIARLEELDELNNDYNDEELNNKSKENKREYYEICKCIQVYEGNISENVLSDNNDSDKDIIESNRNTAPGRKTQSKLPEKCGVKIEDIPKYCWYIVATDKRGDKFVINNHPKLIEQGVKSWSTPESKKKTTLEKFNILMEKYTQLSE